MLTLQDRWVISMRKASQRNDASVQVFTAIKNDVQRESQGLRETTYPTLCMSSLAVVVLLAVRHFLSWITN